MVSSFFCELFLFLQYHSFSYLEQKIYGNACWSDNGEIDVMEQVGYDPNKIVSSVHTAEYNHMKNTQPTHGVDVPDACSNFKIYTLNWTSDQLEMFVGDDNQPFEQRILVWDKGNQGWQRWPFDNDFFIILNIAIGGTWGGQHGIDESIFPKRMEIEWVRFYKLESENLGTQSAPAAHRVIALRSNANGKFVCAENGGNGPLIASRDAVGGWEKFDLITLDGNKVALRSHANGKYVCAEAAGEKPLIVNRNGIDAWETFQMIHRGENKVAFIAVNGKYVCAVDYGRGALTADRTNVDAWETFDLVPQ
ncbi:unnamed protein product [Adineta ricciae]|uniref:GH16 domain-containing protein n=1 Tax=Adineta ricciae TaxID=249248 RepID=A0A814HU30_ADIRI|nr:unnamed protein product [Adineta ricciae]